MADDPIMRAFGRATDTHRGMLRSEPAVPPLPQNGHAGAAAPAPTPTAGSQPLKSSPTSLPVPGPRKQFTHHGYRRAKQELDEQRAQEAAEAAEEDAVTAGSEPATAAPPETDANLAAARRAAQAAWASAAQASAGQCHEAASQQYPPSYAGYGHPPSYPGYVQWSPQPPQHWGWGQAPWQQAAPCSFAAPPPQPPPPPPFAYSAAGSHAAPEHSRQPEEGGFMRHNMAEAPEHQRLQKMAQAATDVNGDEQLAELLMAWYTAGYETGRMYERRAARAQT